MPNDDIAFLSAAATAEAIRNGGLTPVDAVRAYLDRIDSLDSRLSAYITVTREEALDAAEQVGRRLSAGESLGPLAGVPVAVKDQFWTKPASSPPTGPGSIRTLCLPKTRLSSSGSRRQAWCCWASST